MKFDLRGCFGTSTSISILLPYKQSEQFLPKLRIFLFQLVSEDLVKIAIKVALMGTMEEDVGKPVPAI